MRIETGKTTTYQWLCADQQCNNIDCFKGERDTQTVCKLWGARAVSSFHDAALADATKKINSILSRIERSNKNKKRKLSFIKFQNRLLLVWAGYARWGHTTTIRPSLRHSNLALDKVSHEPSGLWSKSTTGV